MITIFGTDIVAWMKITLLGVGLLFMWAVKSAYSERDKCRDCHRCSEPILMRMWKRPMLGPWRAVERLYMRACPECRHRLVADHSYREDGSLMD